MPVTGDETLMVVPLGSGSKGNCIYVGSAQCGVLVDAGLSAKQTILRLEAAGLGHAIIEGVFVGHEHSDHIGAARVLQRKLSARCGREVMFWMTRGTYDGAHTRCRPDRVSWLTPGTPVTTGALSVEGIPSPHDTVDPVVFVITHGELRAAILTDMGRTTQALEDALRHVDIALVEFNHDREMLLNGHYSWPLKQRVLGPEGHLSNAQAADLVARGASKRLKHLILAHLSADNNTPAAALAAARDALQRAGCTDVSVQVAPQDTAMASPPVVRSACRRVSVDPSPHAQ